MSLTIKQLINGDYPRNSRLGRWDRRILVWMMNVALLLASVGVFLDVFDLHFAWHFDSSVVPVQVTVASRHWAYLDLEKVAPNLQANLPENVRPWGLSASVDVPHDNVTSKALSRAAGVPLAVLALAVIWLLRRIVMTTVGTDAAEGDPFIMPNVWRLRIIGVILMTNPVVSMWSQIAETELVLRALPPDLAIPSFEFSHMGIATGILVVIVAEVFKMGVRLREDVEGLV